jgi:hypothetical protein
MRYYQKYLLGTLIVFSPSILFFLIDPENHGAGTVVAVLQGIIFIPFVVWAWVDFRRNPEKYPASAWLIRSLDVVLVGFVALVVGYSYMKNHGYI